MDPRPHDAKTIHEAALRLPAEAYLVASVIHNIGERNGAAGNKRLDRIGNGRPGGMGIGDGGRGRYRRRRDQRGGCLGGNQGGQGQDDRGLELIAGRGGGSRSCFSRSGGQRLSDRGLDKGLIAQPGCGGGGGGCLGLGNRSLNKGFCRCAGDENCAKRKNQKGLFYFMDRVYVEFPGFLQGIKDLRDVLP